MARKRLGSRRGKRAKPGAQVPYVIRGGVRIEGAVAKPRPGNGTGERTVDHVSRGDDRGEPGAN